MYYPFPVNFMMDQFDDDMKSMNITFFFSFPRIEFFKACQTIHYYTKKKESILVRKEKSLKIGLRFLMILAETQFSTISELLWG